MREKKFRAWDGESMFYQADQCDEFMFEFAEDGFVLAIQEQSFEMGSGVAEEIWSYRKIDAEFMQYTGLKDAAGKEVYEGDLLRIPAKNQFEETTFNCFEVFYHDNECIGGLNVGFCMNRMHAQGNSAGGFGYKFTPESIKGHGFVVIGNIHANPELLS